MHRSLTGAGFASAQAEAIVEVLQGGTVTKQDLALAVAQLEGRIDRLDNKVNLILVVAVLSVLAPALTRLLVGS